MPRPAGPSPLAALLLASLCSGCAALLNQVMWTRLLSLVFGSTIEAVSGVTATFMAGLALGSAVGPRLVASRGARDALILYSRVEFAIGASAMALALILPALEPLRASVGALPAWILAITFLLVPAGLMGMTLVIQTQVVAGSKDPAASARASGLLFAANTFGAVAGAYGSVLYFVPALGVSRTILAATALNVTAALVARWRMPSPGAAEPGDPVGRSAGAAAAREPSTASPWPMVMVLGGLFAAGFAGLVNEVAWTRAFILIAGPTVHAFAFVLGAIVLGLATGALFSSGVLSLLPDPRLAFALAQASVAAASAWVIRSLASMPLLYGEEVRRLVDQPEALIGLQAERSLILLFPAAAFSGALFPLGLRLLRSRLGAAHAMGFGGALNTLGAILGAWLTGFILLPKFGLDITLRLAAIVSALSSIAVALSGRLTTKIAGSLAALLALAALADSPSFDQELFAGGAYKYSAYDRELTVEDVLRRGELVFYAEGRVANVSVKRVGSTLSLAVDGKVDATSGGDMLTQRLLAHVPFLINENPRSALVIGLGSGVTASAALSHGPSSVTAVEISAEVIEAARRYFTLANNRVLEKPGLRLIEGDARQHVLATRDRYDVVVSEPSNPWMAGVSALFTREFFTRVKSRLAPGGVFCQWGHLYNMNEADLATLLATFRDVFPSGRVYVISGADILIVGSDGSTSLNDGRLGGISEGALSDLALSKLTPAMLGAIPTVPLKALRWLDGARRHTDDRPVLDFSAPLSIHAQTAAENRRRLLGDDASADAEALRLRLGLLKSSESAEWIYDLGERSLSRGVSDRIVAEEYVRSAVALHRLEAAGSALGAAIERAPRAGLLVARGLLEWNALAPEAALRSLEKAAHLDPKESRAYLLAAEIQSSAGDLQATRKLIARALILNPRDAEALGLAAEAELRDDRLEPARRLAEGALGLDPTEPRALEIRALALARTGRVVEARKAFNRLIEVLPEASAPRSNFGVFELEQGNAPAAARLFKDAADLDPANLAGYRGLREAAVLVKDDRLLQFADRGIARLSR